MTRKPIPMDADQRFLGALLVACSLVLAVVALAMMVAGWAAVADGYWHAGLALGAIGAFMTLASLTVAAWIGRDVIRGEWR